MANLDIANDALILIGEDTISSLSDRSTDMELILSRERKKVLSLLAPPFAQFRTRVSAAGILDCSSKVITFANANPDTVADDGSGFVTAGFEAGNVLVVAGSGVNLGTFGVTTVAGDGASITLDSHETLTAEVLTNDASLKLYASPGHRWAYKFFKPTDNLKILAVNEQAYQNQPDWATEGDYIVTNQISNYDQINVTYVRDVTDFDFYSDLFKELWAIKLASVLAITIKENTEESKHWNKHFDYKLKQTFREQAYESNNDTDPRGETSWTSR